MRRSCPVCDGHVLTSSRHDNVSVDTCDKCGGMWLDSRELQLVLDHPVASSLWSTARQAPSHCRNNHPIARALRLCSVCSEQPTKCPACGNRLSAVAVVPLCVDVCADCRGIWLSAGELKHLQSRRAPTVHSSSSRRSLGWEIPVAAEINPANDPWRAPGQTEPLPQGESVASTARPLSCRHCGIALNAYDAWAFDGDIYCPTCRPANAVSTGELPPDSSP